MCEVGESEPKAPGIMSAGIGVLVGPGRLAGGALGKCNTARVDGSGRCKYTSVEGGNLLRQSAATCAAGLGSIQVQGGIGRCIGD